MCVLSITYLYAHVYLYVHMHIPYTHAHPSFKRHKALTELRTGGPVQKSCTSAALCEDLCSPHPTEGRPRRPSEKKHQNILEVG